MSAQRQRASAPHPRKPPRRPRVPAHRSYTPELLANGRRRYEQTPEPVAAIAADFRIHPGSLRRLAYRLGWVRYNMGPRELPSASRLLAEVEALEASTLPPRSGGEGRLALREQGEAGWGADATAEAPPTPDPSPPFAARMRGGEQVAALPDQTDAPDATLTNTIDRFEKAVREELASVEATRARLKGLPRRPREAETTARTLSSLTETLQKLQRLRCAVPFSGSDDDDMPADIDEFRNELARQIEAFMESRPDEDDAAGTAAESVDALC